MKLLVRRGAGDVDIEIRIPSNCGGCHPFILLTRDRNRERPRDGKLPRVESDHRRKGRGRSIDVGDVYVGDGLIDIEDFVNESYLKIDFRLGIQKNFGNMSIDIFLGVNNLFDKRYNGSIVPNAFGARFFEPSADRNWYVGVGLPVLAD